MQSHLEVMETWFRRVWTEADESAIGDMFQPSAKAEGIGSETVIGPDQFRDFQRAFLGRIENVEIKINRSMESGDWISVFCTMHANEKGSDKPVEIGGSALVKIVDGQLVEAYNYWDFMGLFEKLGLMPENAFQRCLSGEKIA